MKLWKIILGIFGLIGAAFASSSRSKEIEQVKKIIKENKKEEAKVIKQIAVLEKDKNVTKKDVGKIKRKLTLQKKKTKELQAIAESNNIESASDFLKKYKK